MRIKFKNPVLIAEENLRIYSSLNKQQGFDNQQVRQQLGKGSARERSNDGSLQEQNAHVSSTKNRKEPTTHKKKFNCSRQISFFFCEFETVLNKRNTQ